MTYFIHERFESFEKAHYVGVITLIMAKHYGLYSVPSQYMLFLWAIDNFSIDLQFTAEV